MQRRIPFGKALFGFGVAALIAAAVSPATSWLARLQTQALVATPEAYQFLSDETARRFAARERFVLRKNPNDFELHLAAALREPSPIDDENADEETEDALNETNPPQFHQSPVSRKLERLNALQTKWGQNPALPAAVLRTMLSRLIAVNRNYLENIASNYQVPNAPKTDAPTLLRDDSRIGRNSSAHLSLYRENAERGERLDPENAFFPTMLALSLYAERRDAEARAALQRAGQCKRWEDYVLAEKRGEFALWDAVYGRNGVLQEFGVNASVVSPHTAVMRSLARVAIGQAIARERAGDTAAGLDLRRNIARIGALMQDKPGNHAFALTGAAVVRMAATAPGGVFPSPDKNRDGQTREEKQFAAYQDYLLRIGRPDEAAWFKRQRESGQQVWELYETTSGKTVLDTPRLTKIFVGYAASWAALLNAFWMIVFGGVAALALRRKWGIASEPVALPIRLGVGAVFSFLVFVVVCAAVDSIFAPLADTGWEFVVFMSLFAAFGLLTLGFCIFRIWRSARRDGAKARFWPEMGRFGLSVGATVTLIVGIFWPVVQLFILVNTLRYNFLMTTEFNPLTELGLFALAFVASALIPLCLSLYGIGVGLYRREAVVSCIARAFRKTALPAAGVLLLLYVGALIATTALENQASAELRYAIQNERQYLTEIARRP